MIANMKVRNKLVFMIIFPLIGFLYFSGYGTLDRLKVSNEMKSIEDLVHLAVKINLFVHEAQKERGRSSGFLGSKGQNFVNELNEQRKITDTRNSELNSFLANFNSTRFG